jgi:hypothetical protein
MTLMAGSKYKIKPGITPVYWANFFNKMLSIFPVNLPPELKVYPNTSSVGCPEVFGPEFPD